MLHGFTTLPASFQILENNELLVNDVNGEITKTTESDRQHENGNRETGDQHAQYES